MSINLFCCRHAHGAEDFEAKQLGQATLAKVKPLFATWVIANTVKLITFDPQRDPYYITRASDSAVDANLHLRYGKDYELLLERLRPYAAVGI